MNLFGAYPNPIYTASSHMHVTMTQTIINGILKAIQEIKSNPVGVFEYHLKHMFCLFLEHYCYLFNLIFFTRLEDVKFQLI